MILGIALIAVGFLELIVYMTSVTAWGYSVWFGARGPMMERWNYGSIGEVGGTVEKIEQMEIELNVNGTKIDVHGPFWFWQNVGIKKGDSVTAKGVFASVMEPGEGWNEEFVPFQLMIDGKTYGDADKRIPVWMQ